MVLQAVQPGSRSLATGLIERFDLQDDAAETVRETAAGLAALGDLSAI